LHNTNRTSGTDENSSAVRLADFKGPADPATKAWTLYPPMAEDAGEFEYASMAKGFTLARLIMKLTQQRLTTKPQKNITASSPLLISSPERSRRIRSQIANTFIWHPGNLTIWHC